MPAAIYAYADIKGRMDELQGVKRAPESEEYGEPPWTGPHYFVGAHGAQANASEELEAGLRKLRELISKR